MEENNFGKYVRSSEPEKFHKGYVWDTAIGLQDVDGLKTSDFLWETAGRSVYGLVSLYEAEQLVNAYYEEEGKHASNRDELADKAAVRIASLLSDSSFSCTSFQYLAIHKRIFEDIYENAGKVRENRISRYESILAGETIIYNDTAELMQNLDQIIESEMEFSYASLSADAAIKHIAKFIASIWKLHVFDKGNTQTTAVFLMKYLKYLGFDFTNDIFAKNAVYFRNALVRATYNDISRGIHETTEFIDAFLGNLILDENNALQNRDIQIDLENKRYYDPINMTPTAVNGKQTIINDPINLVNSDPINDPINDHVEKKEVEPTYDPIKPVESTEVGENTDPIKNVEKPVDLTRRERSVYDLISNNPPMNRNAMAKVLNCSEATVKRAVVGLTNKGLIRRVGANKNGYWQIAAKIGA